LAVVLVPSAEAAEKPADAKGPLAPLPQKKMAAETMDGREGYGRGVRGAAPRIMAAAPPCWSGC